MTSLSLCKVVIGYSLQLVGNKVLALLLRIITCHKDIAIISKNYAKTLKSMLFDTHLYAHLDRMTALLPKQECQVLLAPGRPPHRRVPRRAVEREGENS